MKITIYNVDYWLKRGYDRYGAEKIVAEKKRETSCRCKEFWIKKGYSEDASILKVKEIQKRNTEKRTADSYKNMLSLYSKEYWIKKGITDDTEINKRIVESKEKSNPYKNLPQEKVDSMIANRLKTYYSKSLSEIKIINKKRGITKEELIKKYGEEKTNDMVKNRGKRNSDFKRYSKISKEFFSKLEFFMNEKLDYGENEKWIRYNENKGFFVDLIKNNKIIEFNGDFFHGNPNHYKENDLIKISKNKIQTVKQIWEKDADKIEKLKKLNYEILIIWEYDVKNNENDVLKKCVEFLKK